MTWYGDDRPGSEVVARFQWPIACAAMPKVGS